MSARQSSNTGPERALQLLSDLNKCRLSGDTYQGGLVEFELDELDAAGGYQRGRNARRVELSRQQRNYRANAARRQKIGGVALDMLAEHYGQADWQRFRSRDPFAFYRAKVEIVEAPPEFRLEVFGSGTDYMTFRFDWFVGERRRYELVISVSSQPAEFLRHAMRQAAWEIERDSGAAVSLRIRGNRAAYEEANK